MKHLVFAAILLLAAPAWAEPLETSFCKDIPDGINFGDSYDSIVEKMGRPPDTCKETPTSKILVCIYDISIPDAFDEFSIVQLGYAFNAGQLKFLMFTAGTPSKTKEERQNLKLGMRHFNHLFKRLYGRSSIFIQKADTGDTYFVRQWEFANNALLIPPLFNDNVIAYTMIIVCPLEPSGHYDLMNY